MAKYLGLSAAGWGSMVDVWWNELLAALIILSAVLGSSYGLFLLFRKGRKSWQSRRQLLGPPLAVTQYLDHLRSTTKFVCPQKGLTRKSTSFGVFLGSFGYPISPAQACLLSQWDIVVLDPLKAGVLAALSSQYTSTQIVGRLDVESILKTSSFAGSEEDVQTIGIVLQTLIASFKRPQDVVSRFNGVLLANWEEHFTPIILNEVIKYMVDLGLEVYLEMGHPHFLTQFQCRDINMAIITGIVFRNGTILPNGDRRNFFQMGDIRPALRALKAQSTMSDSIVMMWETVNDDVQLEHSVVKRSFTWCSFNSAISWIGPTAALTDAEIAVTETVVEEPLGALMWLKGDELMKTHDIWRLNDRICREGTDHSIYDSLQSFLPDLKSRLELFPSSGNERALSRTTIIDGFDWPSREHHSQTNPLSFSSHGHAYTGLGCFQLGLDCSSKDFDQLVDTQRRLRKLKLLEPIMPEELHRIGEKLHAFYETHNSMSGASEDSKTIKELADLIISGASDNGGHLRLHIGLDSGFHTDTDVQFSGLYDVDPSSGVLDIYISAKAQDLAGTILHTFMSSKDYTRAQCFMAEFAMSEQTGCLDDEWGLPKRLVHDIERLSPAETILVVQRLALSDSEEYSVLSARIRSCCEYQLMEVPSLIQLKALNSTAYLRGEISPEDLVLSRLAWYREKGCQHPDTSSAILLFKEIDTRLSDVLMNRQSDILSQLEIVLQTVLQKNHIDASADLFALSVICAFRKLALSEVYLEILDRNPLPNAHPDQAACFAEMFALGSRCESFFDVTPSVLGTVLSDRYRSYYRFHQPPLREDLSTELPTAYASNLIDLDPDAAPPSQSIYYRITFLGIFALPALVDITLLTTIGRGLYVTTYMSQLERSMATTALMVSLLLCGAIGTWITSSGSYYLHSMTFPAMNMFVLTRFIAGLAICIGGGLLTFIILGVIKGFYAGFIFLAYLFILTTYLTVLAALSIYQFPGFPFQSGRVATIRCMPILLISPLITLWLNHDLLVYLTVLIGFLICLLLSARRVISQWGTWYLNVPSVTDTEVVNWYTKTSTSSNTGDMGSMTDLAATPLPRRALLIEVHRERSRFLWTKSTADELVLKLAKGYDANMLLLDWYCKYSRTKMPYPYSPTWNLQCKAAIDTLRDMQKGVKLHNAFVHWRFASDEVWCGVLYFVIALLDKWVVLISGGSLIGLSAANNETYRLAVGFGLAYYLVAAVLLDSVAQPLWQLANRSLPEPIISLSFLRLAANNDAREKQKLYWVSLTKFFFMHVWGLSVTTALMWTFNSSRDGMIMYLSYILAYSGLLWYQYNRIFTGSLVLKNLLVAVVVGLLSGLLLHYLLRHLMFSGVIALGSAAWTAGFLSLWTSKIGRSIFKGETYNIDNSASTLVYHSSGTLGSPSRLSQTTLSEIFASVCAMSDDSYYRLDPLQHPGLEVMDILMSGGGKGDKLMLLQPAFPMGEQLVLRTAELWKSGNTVIDLIPARDFNQQERDMRALSQTAGEQLHILIFIPLDLVAGEWITDIRRNCRYIAETIIQATSESRFGLSHDHATLSGLLAQRSNGKHGVAIPEGIKHQLQDYATEREKVIKNGDKDVLRYSLLGLDCDIEWDNLPRTIRSLLLNRCCGKYCQLDDEQSSWIRSRFGSDNLLEIEEYVARCNLGATVASLVSSYAASLEIDPTHRFRSEPAHPRNEKSLHAPFLSEIYAPKRRIIDLPLAFIYKIHNSLQTSIKLSALCLVAEPDYQRELNYIISDKILVIRLPVRLLLNGIWSFCKSLQKIILPLVLFHGRENVSKLHSNMKGVKTIINKKRVVIESLTGPSTGFITTRPDGSSLFYQYSGDHDQEPEGHHSLIAINTYTDKLVLRRREEYSKQSISNVFTYDYSSQHRGSKLPTERKCIDGDLKGQMVQYDQKGYITTGSTIKGGNLVRFSYWYRKHAKFDDELLRAEFIFPHITIEVSWSVPPPNYPGRLDRWIPYSKVMEATFTQGPEVYRSKWVYEHKFHPVISTTLNGQHVATPDMIQHDWFEVLKKPKSCHFRNDNPLLPFKSVNINFISRMFGANVQRYPISTSRARTYLWKTWKEGKSLDAVTTRWLDEIAVRSDPILKPYWRARDMGRLKAAEKYLHAQADTIMARTDIDPEISSWTPIAFKFSDFLSFGQGGDARINTRTQSAQMQDTSTELHVLAMDTGTWPNEGGGVSACRRDMVNNLDTIRWHIIAESANDFGVPKFQIEKNVQSLTVLPLWGLDFLTPVHGIFQNYLDSEVQKSSHHSTDNDIKINFIPILTTLVRCSRALNLDFQHIEEASKALLDLNTYFASSRHWSDVWMSDVVKDAWRELWLTEDMDNATPLSEWLDAERPTLTHLDNALDMWHRYLFIFSLPVPEEIPDVFQASHHFAGASYGVLCKLKRQCTLHVWDHCISWREVTVFLSSAMSFDSPFVCTSLMSLSRIASVLILHYADVVLPCADFFNPGWEIELGTQQGALGHRRTYQRKIDPVVNGICDMDKFEPIETIKSKVPTVVMLSHVRFVKDIKTAVLAADIIVNKWGFKDYRLEIFGDMEKAPTYSVECQEIIASKSLRDNVGLRGLGNPSKVLEDAWIFLNSSVSEGLPLAMGEAALTGVPVVCTDVGASFRVVTDSTTGKRFSAVVAPNDAYSLARAQITVLGLLDEWSEYADDPEGFHPKLPANPTQEEANMITQRMYEKTEQRRRLGMMGRNNILNGFSEGRYLREHEQMLWIGKYHSNSYRAKHRSSALNTPNSRSSSINYKEKMLRGRRSREFIPPLPSRASSITMRDSMDYDRSGEPQIIPPIPLRARASSITLRDDMDRGRRSGEYDEIPPVPPISTSRGSVDRGRRSEDNIPPLPSRSRGSSFTSRVSVDRGRRSEVDVPPVPRNFSLPVAVATAK